MLGTAPARQGRGLGSAVLRFLCDRADASGLHVYVEATSQRNLQLYERYGFRLIEVRRGYGGLWGVTMSGREGSECHWGTAGGSVG